jgi:predicted SAM-dependent methyltransferase
MDIILEIGCGEEKIFFGSICIDVRRTSIVDVVCDARKLPFPNEMFDHIYASHIIEHFSHRDIEKILQEWIRVLKKNGKLEIRCPDLRIRSLLYFLFPTKQNIENIYGKQDYEYNFHYTGFSFQQLKQLLNNHQIKSVKRVFDGYKGIPFLPSDLHMIGIKEF